MILEVTIEMKDKSAIKAVANEVRNKMISLAKSNLSAKTAHVYTSSLSKVIVTDNTAQFTLQGWLANAIEQGCNPFDMKPGLLSSPKVKINKKGNPYLRVPVSDSPLIVRTVSANSKPGTWIHPGLVPRDFWNKSIYSLKYIK